MTRRWTLALAATTVLGFGSTAYLLATRPRACELAEPPPAAPAPTSAPGADPWLDASPRGAARPTASRPPPVLAAPVEESPLDRRVRRTNEVAAFLGRQPRETDDAYRARLGPLVTAALGPARERVAEMRKLAETKAHVTPAQAAQLDQAFDKIYGDALELANKAIADGTLSPYERNVAGWLEVAGGMGTILGDAQGQIGKILDPAQQKAMYDAGFEWGEYLGLSAPWEKLQAPPPPKP